MGLWMGCHTLVVKDKAPEVALTRPLASIWLWEGYEVGDLFKSAPDVAATAAPAHCTFQMSAKSFQASAKLGFMRVYQCIR